MQKNLLFEVFQKYIKTKLPKLKMLLQLTLEAYTF